MSLCTGCLARREVEGLPLRPARPAPPPPEWPKGVPMELPLDYPEDKFQERVVKAAEHYGWKAAHIKPTKSNGAAGIPDLILQAYGTRHYLCGDEGPPR